MILWYLWIMNMYVPLIIGDLCKARKIILPNQWNGLFCSKIKVKLYEHIGKIVKTTRTVQVQRLQYPFCCMGDRISHLVLRILAWSGIGSYTLFFFWISPRSLLIILVMYYGIGGLTGMDPANPVQKFIGLTGSLKSADCLFRLLLFPLRAGLSIYLPT